MRTNLNSEVVDRSGVGLTTSHCRFGSQRTPHGSRKTSFNGRTRRRKGRNLLGSEKGRLGIAPESLGKSKRSTNGRDTQVSVEETG